MTKVKDGKGEHDNSNALRLKTNKMGRQKRPRRAKDVKEVIK
jgi:hypothetical protein